MRQEQMRIEFNGAEVEELYSDMVRLEVELDDEMAGMFHLQIGMAQEEDGSWRYADDERFALWTPVTVKVDFEEGQEEVISGYITHVRVEFGDDSTRCLLELSGMDGSVLMDRDDKLMAWTNKKDSDIAAEILQSYGFAPEVDDTQVIHDEAVSTIIQRESDMQLLKRLALRNGFECFVDGTSGYFRAPQIDAEPQPVLAAHFGADTTLTHFSAELNALAPANVSMWQIDRASKEVVDATVESGTETVLGKSGGGDLLGAGMMPAQVYVSKAVVTSAGEMTALCQGLFHKGQWFVDAEGVIDAARYGHVLKPRGTVPIKGVGETHSGLYYVSHVTHRFESGVYEQEFRARRNAIGARGDEPFAAEAA